MNFALLGRAFVRMPRVTPVEWADVGLLLRWILVIRPAVLGMTFSAALLAGGLALRDGRFDPLVWALTTAGLLLAHATNNLVNDLTDYWKGTDSPEYFRGRYGVHPLAQGLLGMRSFVAYLGVTAVLALVVGAYLVYLRQGQVLALFGAGVFFVLFYTWPLKHLAMGEVAVFIVWGPLMVGGAHYVTTGTWSHEAALIGSAFALGPSQVIFGKHVDKIDDDDKRKIRTLPALLGERRSRSTVIGLMALQLVATLALVATGVLGLPCLVVLVAVPSIWKVTRVYRRPRPAERPRRWPEDIWPLWFSAWSFLHSARFAGLLLLGLLAELLLAAMG